MSSRSKGFTIVEIMIALAVFAFAIPALSIGIRNLIAINNRARDLAIVNIIVNNKAEQVRSAGFNSLNAGSVDFSSELPDEIAGPKSAVYSVSFPENGIAEVSFVVSYKDYNKVRTLEYETIVSELGVGQ